MSKKIGTVGRPRSKTSNKSVDFTGVTFVSTNFTGATYDDDTIWPDGFNLSDHGLVKAK